ncbi:insulin-like growth factor-binding protein complex acid labile subunit [Venturia canescens]|uniref:insulin-like growth factor-binding protein complex acid labile subunit n=1 Tax=Venturia canescens TaxID=32260 RepID=UPI001C9CC2A8|nr:insulin-like growth factor-binding protein complex acid labile subunit [Venturia canescens]
MSGLLYTLLGLAASFSLHCAVRREISPCTCRQEDFSTPVIQASPPATVATDPNKNNNGNANNPNPVHMHGERIEVVCERMESFGQVADALRGKFTAEQQITLRVAHSQLRDISRHDFKDLRMSITKLELNHDHLSSVDGEVFAGLGRTQFLSLADNEVPSVPRHILSHLSLLRTLDLSRNRISRIDSDDFKYNPTLQHLSMAGNSISEMVPGSLPPLVRHLHVGRNQLKTLNRTLRDLNQLEWLLINSNKIATLDGELPASGHNLKMLYAVDNELTHLPREFHHLHRLETLFLQHNKIRSLNGTLKKARRLKFLEISHNELQELNEEDFVEAELLEDLELGHNSLKSLGGAGGRTHADGSASNSALWPLRSLKCLNLTHNELDEFSFVSVRGLRELRLLDLSNNRIARLLRGRPPTENLVEEEGDETAGSSIQDLQLQHNELRSLEGSLFVGMRELQRLNLSHNALGPTIGPQDLSGLGALKVLDVSHNKLTTLEDTSETWLPALEELNASHNLLVTLSERDFRRFPILCSADVTANKVRSLTPELVANTRCTVHGVPDVLRIYLQDNPILCDAGLADLTVALEVNHAKVYGFSNDCPTTTKTPTEVTTPRPPLPQTLFLAAAAAGGNVSFAATLE